MDLAVQEFYAKLVVASYIVAKLYCVFMFLECQTDFVDSSVIIANLQNEVVALRSQGFQLMVLL